MKRSILGVLLIISSGALSGCSFFDQGAKAPSVSASGPAQKSIERNQPVSHVHMDVRHGKYYLDAEANGQQGEFIFDTGSPTILSQQFAQKIGLKAVGHNRGVDANGTQLVMDIAILDRLDLGGTVFRNLPVLIHDFSDLDVGNCLIGDGVLGSELLPGSAWRIDEANAKLSIAETARAMGVSSKAVRQKLYDSGYPHLPIIDYRVGDVAEKALFDTGNSERVVLFKAVANNPSMRSAIVPNTTMVGAGFQGESAGGMGGVEELARFTLKDFEIGTYHLGESRGTTRAHAPTLVGAGILQDHVVTLDYPNGDFILEKRGAAKRSKAEAGYAVSYRNGHAEVVQMFNGSRADRAGLKLGDHVIAINGHGLALPKAGAKCDQVNWLIGRFDPRKAATLQIERGGQRKTIKVPG